jgi:hypothetical protein
MPDEQNPTTDPAGQAPPVTDPAAAPPAPPATTPPAPTNNVDELPEWARKAIEKGNTEAATYRTKLRDAEAKLGAAKSQEDIDAAIAELKTSNAKLERDLLVATVGADLPPELRELLKGETEAELKAHADVLRKFAAPAGPTPPSNLNGGLDPTKNKDEFDPEAFANDWRSGRIERASVSGRIQ